MTSSSDGVVRLRPSYNGTGYMTHDGGDSPAYVALPEAQHAALVRVVEDAQAYIDSGIVDAARAVSISNRITAALRGGRG